MHRCRRCGSRRGRRQFSLCTAAAAAVCLPSCVLLLRDDGKRAEEESIALETQQQHSAASAHRRRSCVDGRGECVGKHFFVAKVLPASRYSDCLLSLPLLVQRYKTDTCSSSQRGAGVSRSLDLLLTLLIYNSRLLPPEPRQARAACHVNIC